MTEHNFSGRAGHLQSYSETIDYLYKRLPMFTRVGASALKADLKNTLDLCHRLGNPQQKFKSIHVGGTNGKGSTSHMLAAILQTAGYKAGLYTSPHLKDFRERIRINGEMIPEKDVVDFVNQQKDNIENIDPSFFELTVALAFKYFADQQVDVAVIEVGLGGRLDSTNIITPQLSIITNIGFDHIAILGDTLPQIAYEKAGIIKPGIPVIIGEKHTETSKVFSDKALETGSKLVFASDEWIISKSPDQTDNEFLNVTIEGKDNELSLPELKLDLPGSYQLKNIAAVLSAVMELRKLEYKIDEEHISNALKNVKNLTGLMGRWQILGTDPLIICDTGHNEDGVKEVIKNITAQKFDNLRMVIGMVKDKDISKVLSLLPTDATYYFCHPDLPRAKPADELQAEATTFGLKGASYGSVKEAFEAAKSEAHQKDLIFVGGSTFVVAEVV